jgi:hypothetical protein
MESINMGESLSLMDRFLSPNESCRVGFNAAFVATHPSIERLNGRFWGMDPEQLERRDCPSKSSPGEWDRA